MPGLIAVEVARFEQRARFVYLKLATTRAGLFPSKFVSRTYGPKAHRALTFQRHTKPIHPHIVWVWVAQYKLTSPHQQNTLNGPN